MVGSNPVKSSTKNLFTWSQQSSDMTIDGIYTYTPVPINGSRRVSQELEFSAVAFNFLSQSLPFPLVTRDSMYYINLYKRKTLS